LFPVVAGAIGQRLQGFNVVYCERYGHPKSSSLVGDAETMMESSPFVKPRWKALLSLSHRRSWQRAGFKDVEEELFALEAQRRKDVESMPDLG
jgi:hypothetical protein